ncbi:hypothetical protein Tco_0231595 [Tanacetum coccineum]
MKMEILLESTSNKLMVGDLCDSIRIKLVTTGKKQWCDSIRIKLVPARNPVKEILLKLNLPDHRSILTDSKVTPTKHGRMTKPYSSPRFIANCFNAGYLKMEVKVDPHDLKVTPTPNRANDKAHIRPPHLLQKTYKMSIKVKEFQRSFRHSDTERLSQSDEVLKLKNFKKDATLKLFKSTNQERIHPSFYSLSLSSFPSHIKDYLYSSETLTAELERYKEQVKIFEQRQTFDLNDREKYIDGQLRKVIVDRNAKVADFEKQIHSLKLQLNATVESHKTLSTTVDLLKKESKEKKDKYLDEIIDLQKKESFR